jgi:hypothetical protein
MTKNSKDNEDKWSSPMPSYQEMQNIKKLFDSGVLKLDTKKNIDEDKNKS